MSKKEVAPVDLAQFDAAVAKQEEGILVPILGMDGKTSLGFSIRVAGPDSKRAKDAQEELADELIESENLTRLQAREVADRGYRYLAKVTMGWEPAIVLDGQEMAYSEENAEKLYRRFNFIKEQVDRAAGNRTRFTKG
jgi:hypothetical protein